MQVFFYLPEKYLPDAARQEAWKSGTLTTLEEGGKIASAQAWIYQTWVELQKAGCAVALTHELPTKGILVALSGCLPVPYRPGPELFLADIAADGLPHPAAHRHLVQNAAHASRLPHAIFLPHWPQPHLLPRDPARGDQFENLGFFGDAANLVPALRDPAWQRRLTERTGLTLRVVGASGWHDYRDMDCVLAVRDWGRAPWLRKPGTKLYNAWLAGVPFVGGGDSAYRRDGTPGLNYLAALDLQEAESHLGRLRDDLTLRHSLVSAGREAAEKFHRDAIRARWQELVETTLPNAAAEWKSRSRPAKAVFRRMQAASAWVDRTFR